MLVDVVGLDAIVGAGTGSHVLDAVVEGVVLRPVVPSCAVNSAVLAVVDMSCGRSYCECACNIAGLRPNGGRGGGFIMSPKRVLLGYTYTTSVFCLPPLLQVACRVLQGTSSITELFGREAISRTWQRRNSPHILKAHLGRPQNTMVIISGIVL